MSEPPSVTCRVSYRDVNTQVKDNSKKKIYSKSSESKPNRNKRDGGEGEGSGISKGRNKGKGESKKKRDDTQDKDNTGGFDIRVVGIWYVSDVGGQFTKWIRNKILYQAQGKVWTIWHVLYATIHVLRRQRKRYRQGSVLVQQDEGQYLIAQQIVVAQSFRTVRYDFMLTRCQNMIRRSVKRAKRHGMLRQSVNTTIDEHDIPFYAKCMNMLYAVFSKDKKAPYDSTV